MLIVFIQHGESYIVQWLKLFCKCLGYKMYFNSYVSLTVPVSSVRCHLFFVSASKLLLDASESQCISVWYSNATNQDCKALQRVVGLAEHISGSALPSLQDIYLKRCKSRAAKIIKDSNHPGKHFFHLLPSGKLFRSMMAKTERLRRSFFPQTSGS